MIKFENGLYMYGMLLVWKISYMFMCITCKYCANKMPTITFFDYRRDGQTCEMFINNNNNPIIRIEKPNVQKKNILR